MAITSLFFLSLLSILSSPFLSSASDLLSEGSSLSVEKTNDILISPNNTFVAGFFPVGDNAYSFAIWFNEPFCNEKNCTVVWMANRDQPVNGKLSKLSLLKSGNLVLADAGKITVWVTNTFSKSSVQLYLEESGNLVLKTLEGVVLWESFNFPTDTLLPLQPLVDAKQLVSSRSESNYSSGLYRFYFDTDNVLHLLYHGSNIQSIYWPDPDNTVFSVHRNIYNNSRTAYLDPLGNFSSSDHFHFMSVDYGQILQRRLTMDSDGNLRLYSRKDIRENWSITWQAMSQPCKIHGSCGPNSVCSYDHTSGRKCSCLQGFKMKNVNDWSLGCEQEFNLSCSTNEATYLQLTHVDFYGYDFDFLPNHTLDTCKSVCSQRCDCKGFQLRFDKPGFANDTPYCFMKSLLLNGFSTPNFEGAMYVKVPKTIPFSQPVEELTNNRLHCSSKIVEQLDRVYAKSKGNETVKFALWFSWIIGAIEFFVIFLVWCLLIRTHLSSDEIKYQEHLQEATGFRKFTYNELKKATRGFSKEIGRGAGGIVYKGILSDNKVAAIKQLITKADQGEAEFWAEISIIGNLNHMNLIEIWGYCAEGNHKLLVYEYMENGSLAENLSSDKLDWEKRFSIALGSARGLGYLHEECLDWVLHCDVKPQNILLDYDFQPKVSDFGLSRLLRRDSNQISKLSRIRGTRGYIAPEWVFNLPITSKVDVYSYGMVLLEIVTGKSPTEDIEEDTRLVTWVKEKINDSIEMEKIVDPKLQGKYNKTQMEILVRLALKCVEEDKDARPTMKQVVQILLQDQEDTESV